MFFLARSSSLEAPCQLLLSLSSGIGAGTLPLENAACLSLGCARSKSESRLPIKPRHNASLYELVMERVQLQVAPPNQRHSEQGSSDPESRPCLSHCIHVSINKCKKVSRMLRTLIAACKHLVQASPSSLDTL